MESILKLISEQGAGIVALSIILYQYTVWPKKLEKNEAVIRDLKKVIEDNNRTMETVCKTMNGISEKLGVHQLKTDELEFKFETVTETMATSLDKICECVAQINRRE